jgi:hypothetical protein
MAIAQPRQTYELVRTSARCGGRQSLAVVLRVAHSIVCHWLPDSDPDSNETLRRDSFGPTTHV